MKTTPSNVFKAGGHEWPLVITAGSLSRVRSQCGLDLAGALENGETISALLSDGEKIAKVVWELVRPLAGDLNISRDAFMDLMSGDVLEQASGAMLEAVILFFPQATKRQALRAMVAELMAAWETYTQEQIAEVESGELRRGMLEAMRSASVPAGSGVASSR